MAGYEQSSSSTPSPSVAPPREAATEDADIPESRDVPASTRSTTPPSARGRAYEELEGGQGRGVFFRPQRYGRADLGPVRPVVRLAFDGGERECELHDVSQNGIAVVWGPVATPPIGAVHELTVTFDGYEAYRGGARVSSVRTEEGRTLVGLSFLESLMNVDDVLHLRDVKSWGADARGLGLADPPWRASGHERFKAAVAEMRLFLDDASTRLAEVEASLPWTVVHGPIDSPPTAALVDRIRREFVGEFVHYTETIDSALRGVPEADWHRLKEFSLRHVHEPFMRAPFMHRCRTKPLGYPGDFEVMRFLYEKQFEGPTLFAKAVHLATVWTRGAQAVRTRKDLVKSKLCELIAARKGKEPVRIVSVAAGPAQELYELLRETPEFEVPIEIAIFDQDKQALAFAHGRLARAVDARHKGRIRLTFLHDSIKRLLNDPYIFGDVGPFDVIFCAGLFDYLRFSTAATLCKHFYTNLAPGGVAYVGNMVPWNPCRWFLEHHLEWYLIYRTPEEMLEYGRMGVPEASLGIIHEPTGINPFLTVART